MLSLSSSLDEKLHSTPSMLTQVYTWVWVIYWWGMEEGLVNLPFHRLLFDFSFSLLFLLSFMQLSTDSITYYTYASQEAIMFFCTNS